MANLNVVHLIGNLTREPELRVTQTGIAVCQFGLAINHKWKTESGEAREEVLFVDVTAWGKQAETINKYVVKGRPLYVQGRLKLDTWEDKQSGAKRSKISVVLSSFQFLGGRMDEGEGVQGDAPDDTDQAPPPRFAPPSRSSAPPRASRPGPQDDPDEDVPF